MINNSLSCFLPLILLCDHLLLGIYIKISFVLHLVLFSERTDCNFKNSRGRLLEPIKLQIMKSYFLFIFILLSQFSFGKGNTVFFEGFKTVVSLENKAINQLNLKIGVENWNTEHSLTKVPKIKKAKIITLASLFNILNVCLLLLFILVYFLLIFLIQLVHKHYMELE